MWKRILYIMVCLTFISNQAYSGDFDRFPVLKQTINLEKTYSFTLLITTCGAVFKKGDSGEDKTGDELYFYLRKASNVTNYMLGQNPDFNKTKGYMEDFERWVTEMSAAERDYDIWSRLKFICGDHR